MRHDEMVRPCSICNDPDGKDFEGDIFVCDSCREAYEPMTPAFSAILVNEGHEDFCNMLTAYKEIKHENQ